MSERPLISSTVLPRFKSFMIGGLRYMYITRLEDSASILTWWEPLCKTPQAGQTISSLEDKKKLFLLKLLKQLVVGQTMQ